MSDKIIPLFKSHYSLGRSILTLEKAGETSEQFGKRQKKFIETGEA